MARRPPTLQANHWGGGFFLRRFLTASAALLALVAAASTAMGADVVPAISTKIDTRQTIGREALAYYGSEISRFKQETWHWQRVTGAKLTPATRPDAQQPSRRRPSQRTAAEMAGAACRGARERPASAPSEAVPLHPTTTRAAGRTPASPTTAASRWTGSFQQKLRRLAPTRRRERPRPLVAHRADLDGRKKALKSRGYWPWPNTAKGTAALL